MHHTLSQWAIKKRVGRSHSNIVVCVLNHRYSLYCLLVIVVAAVVVVVMLLMMMMMMVVAVVVVVTMMTTESIQ